jgi:putative transposase
MDLFSRQVVDLKIEEHMQENLVRESLEKALLRRGVKSVVLIHCSGDRYDQGGQYLSRRMKLLVKTFKLRQSMYRADDPYDNAWAESLWSRLKTELEIPKGSYSSLVA